MRLSPVSPAGETSKGSWYGRHGVLILVVGVAAAVLLGWLGSQRIGQPAAAVNLSPLILTRRQVHMAGALSGGMRLAGTIYPAIPGRNVLNLRVDERSGRVDERGTIALTFAMPGMHMTPVQAWLRKRRDAYNGTVTLPMFGVYRVRAVLSTVQGRRTGVLILKIPIIPSH